MIRDVEEVAKKTYQRPVAGGFADSRETRAIFVSQGGILC